MKIRRTKKIKTPKKFQKPLFLVLFVLTVALVTSYAGLVRGTIYKTAERERARTDTIALQAKISELGFQYVAFQNKISKELAFEMGFKEIENPAFITHKEVLSSISLNSTR